MKRKFLILLMAVFAISLFCPRHLFAQVPSPIPKEKREVILKLMRLTHSTRLADEIKARVIGALKQSFPDVPASYWKSLDKRIDVRELLNSFIPIYAKNLSLEDLKQIVQFYESPAGQHYLAARKKMVAASMETGKKWAMGWIVQVFKELKAKGYKPRGKHPGIKGDAKHSPNS